MKIHNSLFLKYTYESFYLVKLVYVDVIILPANSQSQIDLIKQYLHSSFHIKDLETLKFFLLVLRFSARRKVLIFVTANTLWMFYL